MEVDQNEIESIDPQPRTVLVRGVEHLINPPKFATFIRLQKILGQLDLDVDVLDDAKLESMESQARVCIDKCVPSLTGQELGAAETISLANYILELGTPKKAAAKLQERGITLDGEKKAN